MRHTWKKHHRDAQLKAEMLWQAPRDGTRRSLSSALGVASTWTTPRLLSDGSLKRKRVSPGVHGLLCSARRNSLATWQCLSESTTYLVWQNCNEQGEIVSFSSKVDSSVAQNFHIRVCPGMVHASNAQVLQQETMANVLRQHEQTQWDEDILGPAEG